MANSVAQKRMKKRKGSNQKRRAIYCIECEGYIQARLTTGHEVYPHRSDLHHLPFWLCDTCKNFVGCHHKTQNPTEPLGCIPNPEMKNARMHIHALLDPLWQNGLIKRNTLYARIRKEMGYKRKYHTAQIRSIEEARKIYRAIQRIKRSLGK